MGRIALVLCVLLVVPTVSYVRALLYPGNAPFSVRSVEWVRDHGGGGIIDAIETWKYSRQAPPVTGTPKDVTAIPATSLKPGSSANLPTITLLPGVRPLAHEGSWTPVRQNAKGRALLWTSWFRPDSGHLPVTVGAALIPSGADTLHLMPGTREPIVGMKSAAGYSVPASARSKLVAVFNSGFKMKDSHGGWWTPQAAAVPLVDGRASLVINRDGSAQVGSWNKTVRMTPQVVAVRQNLDVLLTGGQLVAGLAGNAHGNWGTARSQFQYTWRSGIGTDARGNLIYIGGQGLTLATLATAMQHAGIQEGMELDIHSYMVSFNIEQQTAKGGITGRRLLGSMNSPADRYLHDDQRDFFYVVSR
ncbi:MAG: hypothetical protein QOG10_1803 [Kribbellaceae bacterium]|nr:hypothetical protein [Kribbellaceae bacterium]